jgi:hypothetical protein
MNANKALGLSVLVLGAALVGSMAGARPAYRQLAAEQFKLLDKDGKFDSLTCQYCHTTERGGPSWNPFGELISVQFFGKAEKKLADALYLTLAANKDSDEDGYTDVLEVVAKTLPGDAKSKPEQKLEELEAMLKDMGGVDTFKPKAK